MKKAKRYTVTADFYIYADDDADAKQQALDWVREFKAKEDNQALVLSIHETPFASISARKLK